MYNVSWDTIDKPVVGKKKREEEIFKHFRHQWADTKKVTLFKWTTWNSFRGCEVLQSQKQMYLGFHPQGWYCGVWENLPTETRRRIIKKGSLLKQQVEGPKSGGKTNNYLTVKMKRMSAVIANHDLKHLQISIRITWRQREPQNQQQSHLAWEALLWMSRRGL